MARGQQKIQSQQKAQAKLDKHKKGQGSDQKKAAKAALIFTCTVCKVSKTTTAIIIIQMWKQNWCISKMVIQVSNCCWSLKCRTAEHEGCPKPDLFSAKVTHLFLFSLRCQTPRPTSSTLKVNILNHPCLQNLRLKLDIFSRWMGMCG